MEQISSWKSLKVWTVLLGSLVLLIGLFSAVELANPEIHFLDPALELVIREKIERPSGPINRADVQTITEIHAADRGILSLEGIGYLGRLAFLDLENNQIDDLTPLSSLRKLAELNLRNNQVWDMQPLTEHRRLLKLDLRGNQIADIASLCRSKDLAYLNLRGNKVEDISQLACNTNLVYLNVHSNPISSGLDQLAFLTNLETLIMRNVNIGDESSFLQNLTKLTRLNIRNTGISDVSPIVELMASGALQDNPNAGVKAVVDMLEISPTCVDCDPYLELRRYWDNVDSKLPLSLPYYPSQVLPPTFSHPSGFYDDPFYLHLTTEIQGAQIFYTLDGSDPALTPDLEPKGSTVKYDHPIYLVDRTKEPNELSLIRTSYLPIGDYFPQDSIHKGNVIRAVLVSSSGERSEIVSHSIFIDCNNKFKHAFPILSIITNPDNFFDDKIGIYVPGDFFNPVYEDVFLDRMASANYTQRGLKWERPATIQLFNYSGYLEFEKNLGVRVHGGSSRAYPKKSLRLYAREEYDGTHLINYDFFPELKSRQRNEKVDTFETLILRTGGGGDEWVTGVKDIIGQSLLSHTDFDIQGFFPVIVYINGEYWGIHYIRTRYDEHYFQSYYEIEPDQISVLQGIGAEYSHKLGPTDSYIHYEKLIHFIERDYQNNSYATTDILQSDREYNIAKSFIDIDSYITFYVASIYFNKSDLLGSNVLFWRKNVDQSSTSDHRYGHDGKWRWMIIDLDFTFRDADRDLLSLLALEDGENYYNKPWQTFLFRSFLQNDGFVVEFINTFADHLNTTFREDVVLKRIDEIETLMLPEVEKDIYRWSNANDIKSSFWINEESSVQTWLNNLEEVRQFAMDRPFHQRNHIINFFKLPGSAEINIQLKPEEGFVILNSIILKGGEVGVDDPSNWSGIYFQGIPIVLTAKPSSGYRFLRWEGLDCDELVDPTSETIVLSIKEDLILSPVFIEIESPTMGLEHINVLLEKPNANSRK